MPGIETQIWLALRQRIETLPGGLPFAWPASVYQPGADAYLAVGRVTITPQRVFVAAGPHERTGTLIITHVAPLGQDVDVYDEAAAQIAGHFPEDLCMAYQSVRVRVVSAPHVMDGFRENGWWRTPVVIRWRCAA